jgi:hypothetical protein
MEVTFYKPSEKRRLCAWTARRRKRTVVPGTVMAAGDGLPHDLGQYVVEATIELRSGFWGLLERGATFKSTGRKVTKPGRALIRARRDGLNEAETLAGDEVARWRRGEATETGPHLTAALDAWQRLDIGDGLVFRWPDPVGAIVPGAGADHG